MGCDDYGDTTAGTGAPGYTGGTGGVGYLGGEYARLPLCIDPGSHYFQLDNLKRDIAVCTRCGLIRDQSAMRR
jgi:hypothetical protein